MPSRESEQETERLWLFSLTQRCLGQHCPLDAHPLQGSLATGTFTSIAVSLRLDPKLHSLRSHSELLESEPCSGRQGPKSSSLKSRLCRGHSRSKKARSLMLNTDTLCLLVKMLAVPSSLFTLVRALTAIPKALTLTLRTIGLGPQKLPSLLPRSQNLSERDGFAMHFPVARKTCFPYLCISQRTQWLLPNCEVLSGVVDKMVSPSPQHICLPGTCECDLIWKKGLHSYNQFKDLRMKSSWITRVDPKSNDSCSIGDRREDADTQRGRPCENDSRDWGYASQEAPGATRRWKRQGGFCCRASGEMVALLTA